MGIKNMNNRDELFNLSSGTFQNKHSYWCVRFICFNVELNFLFQIELKNASLYFEHWTQIKNIIPFLLIIIHSFKTYFQDICVCHWADGYNLLKPGKV